MRGRTMAAQGALGRTNGPTRRRLLAAGGSFALSAGALGLAACSGGNSGNGGKPSGSAPAQRAASAAPAAAASAATAAAASPATAASRPAAATPAPKKGGSATTAQTTDILLNNGHPFVLYPQNGLLLSAVHEPLIRYRDDIRPEMVLAERFEFNSDRTQVTIALKPGLTFHNGAPVTPDDVLFGIDVILNPQKHGITANFQVINFAKMIKASQKVDDRTMQFTLDQPRVNFADFFAQVEVVQAATYDKLTSGKDIQGTGPYTFVSWTPNQGYRLEPNKNWWGTTQFGGPWLDAIESKIFADYDAIGLAYESGAVDWAAVTAQVAKPYQGKNQTATGHKAGLNYVGCVVTNPLLKDSRVRQALFYALDRARFVNEVQEGFGSVTVQPWPNSSPAFDPALEAPFYDPNKAKDLLKQAGFSQDKPLLLEYATPASDTYAAVVKENFDAVGVKVELKPTEGNAFTARFANRQFADFFISGHSFADLSPLTNFQQTFPYRIPNISYYEAPEYLDIIKQLSTLDPLSDAARAQYKRFNQLWLNDPWLLPMTPNIGGINIISPKMHNIGHTLITIANQQDFGLVWKG